MESSELRPEQIMLPPSPAESVESIDSAAPELSTGGAGKTKQTEHVMLLTLPLPTQPSASPRNRSPFSRSHFRSRSLAELPTAPPMMRAHSSPGLDSRGRYIFVNNRGASDVPNAKRYGALQGSAEEYMDARMSSLNISETIAEHPELDMTARSSSSQAELQPTSPALMPHAFPRIGRRRPSSPLNFHGSAQSVNGLSSSHPSPLQLNSKYNESYPTYSVSSASSMPSTPTSLRSRSPSISSLETIPDIPDAEEAAAIEADQMAASKAAADREDPSEAANNASRRRGTSDVSGPSGPFANMRTGSGGYGIRADKRKRWSVCGAERRQDLDLETIWED